MKAKKHIKCFVLFSVFVLISVTLLNFTVDPFYLFHKPIWKRLIFIRNHVFTNLGQIETFLKKTNDYDTVLIGACYTENFIGEEISEVLNSKGTLKLSLKSAYSCELETIARTALESHKVKKVLWGFDIHTFSQPAHTPCDSRVFPHHLYQKQFEKYFLAFNIQILKESLSAIVYRLSNKKFFSASFDNNLSDLYYYNADDLQLTQKLYNNFHTLGSLNYIRKRQEAFKDFKYQPSTKAFSAIDEHFIKLVKECPDVEFYVLIVPYSYAYFIELDEQTFNDNLACQRYLIEKCAQYSNVKFYAFHTCEFPQNLGNYFDVTHYHPDINRYMLYTIQKDLHRLSLTNLDAYEKAMLENLYTFEVKDAYPQKDTLADVIQQEANNPLK